MRFFGFLRKKNDKCIFLSIPCYTEDFYVKTLRFRIFCNSFSRTSYCLFETDNKQPTFVHSRTVAIFWSEGELKKWKRKKRKKIWMVAHSPP